MHWRGRKATIWELFRGVFHHNEALQGANMKLAFFDNYKLGVVVSVSGALMVSIDTSLIVHTLALPEPLARMLLWRV